MTIQIGGQQFTEAEVIAAIAASNDADHTHTVSAYSSLDEVSGVLQPSSIAWRLLKIDSLRPVLGTESHQRQPTASLLTGSRHWIITDKTIIVTFEVPKPPNYNLMSQWILPEASCMKCSVSVAVTLNVCGEKASRLGMVTSAFTVAALKT